LKKTQTKKTPSFSKTQPFFPKKLDQIFQKLNVPEPVIKQTIWKKLSFTKKNSKIFSKTQ